jgi:ribosomal protein S18 acetylase RimI-like enzyme
MQTTIRQGRPADAAAVAGLTVQLGEVGHGQPEPGVEERFRKLLELPGYLLLVAENEGGRVIGLLNASQRWTLWHTGPCVLIEELVVDREARRQGVGRALIEATLGWARAQGCSEVELSTETDNLPAQAFYRKLGFESEALLLEYEMD